MELNKRIEKANKEYYATKNELIIRKEFTKKDGSP